MADSSKLHVWRNFNGTFTDIGVPQPAIDIGLASWGNYDADGDLDLLVIGYQVGGPYAITRFLHNYGSDRFAVEPWSLPDLEQASADWGDYDNDGDMDLLLSGLGASDAQSARLYRNDGGTFVDANATFDQKYSKVAWGDFDGDGALDCVVYGDTLQVFHNNATPNTPPVAPGGLVANVRGSRVDFRWNQGSDTETFAGALSYNLRVGTTPGGQDVFTASADPATGRRLLSGLGNVQLSRTHHLTLPPGTYYWSVQTVDSGYAASPFATEQSFTVLPPTAADCGPGTALILDGVNNYVSVADSAALDAYPLTLTAWIKTTHNSTSYAGIVNKYASSSGYSLFLYSGHLRAWYFRNGTTYIYDGVFGIDGGPVADGKWHFVALVVDAAGGRLFVDGAQTGSLAWTGTPGTTTTTVPLRIGLYSTSTYYFPGQIDEVGLWNVAFSPAELNELRALHIGGAEPGLVAYWNFNEGRGLTAGDLTGHGHDGDVLNGPAWTPSGATICAPIVRTAALLPSDIGSTAARLTGTVNPQGSAATMWFDYGPTTSYGNSTAPTIIWADRDFVIVTAKVDYLSQTNTYHFRCVATNQFGRVNGLDQSFETTPYVYNWAPYQDPFYQLDFTHIVLANFYNDSFWGGERLDFVQNGSYSTGGQRTYGSADPGPEPGYFTDTWFHSPGLSSGALAAGDFDNDGQIDLFLAGVDTNATAQSFVLRNVAIQSKSFSFAEMPHTVPGLRDGGAAFGDFDNDGDLDLAVSGESAGGAYCAVFRNDHGAFTNTAAVLSGLLTSSLAWGDFDNDGDLDLLATGTSGGQSQTIVYRNDGGVFTNIQVGLIGVHSGAAVWGDYDLDGQLDIAICGIANGGARICRVYHNDGGIFTNIGGSFTGAGDGSLAWGDLDDDGYPDLVITGSVNGTALNSFTRIYLNRIVAGIRTFVDAQASLPGVIYGDIALGDCGGDGSLDIVLGGRGTDSMRITELYLNQSLSNIPPSVPAGLQATQQVDRILLSWLPSTDAETAANGLTYNLRVGTAPGGTDVVSPHANPATGLRDVAAMGNVQTGTNAWLRLPLAPITGARRRWTPATPVQRLRRNRASPSATLACRSSQTSRFRQQAGSCCTSPAASAALTPSNTRSIWSHGSTCPLQSRHRPAPLNSSTPRPPNPRATTACASYEALGIGGMFRLHHPATAFSAPRAGRRTEHSPHSANLVKTVSTCHCSSGHNGDGSGTYSLSIGSQSLFPALLAAPELIVNGSFENTGGADYFRDRPRDGGARER